MKSKPAAIAHAQYEWLLHVFFFPSLMNKLPGHIFFTPPTHLLISFYTQSTPTLQSQIMTFAFLT